MLIHTSEPVQPGFGKAPEAFNAIDVGSTSDKFILPMINTQVLAIADIDQAVITAPTIRIDDAIQGNTAPDNSLVRGFTAVWDDLGVDTTVTLEYPKDSRLAECATSPFAFDSTGAEVRFIDFDFASERRLEFTIFCNENWPNAGMGNVYPDDSTGNCSTCHTRHKFSIAEARKPAACASCHLGPDHPNIEIFENSKHGHIYLTEGESWKWDTAPDAWEPGDYRGPTCATCHMSGIGELKTTHNINERLYWNLWAKESKVRNSTDVMSPLLGNGPEGRKQMKQVCNTCHSSRHTDGFFAQGDKAVKLYNVAYWAPAKKMHDELNEKGLLKENPWNDEFQITFYHLWHHQGRRARQGAMMGGPDWAHWHGFFELQQDIYKLEDIYNKRVANGKIED